jgi:multiple sugar transport system permease protein
MTTTTTPTLPAAVQRPTAPRRPARTLGSDGRRRVAVAATLVGLVLGALFAGAPVIWMVFSSLKSNPEIFAYPPQLITENSSLAPYLAILSDARQLRFFFNSYLISLSVALLTLLVAVHAAYAFSRYDFPGKSIVNVAVISVQAVPPITLLIPYFGLVVALGLYNTYPGLILTYMVFTLPYAIIMMTGYFNTLPKELDEAARVDGTSSFGALWRILIPISIPGMVSVGMYTFMIAWNEYLFALTLTRTDDMRTVPIGIQLLMGQHSYDWNQMMAMSVLGSLPVILLFIFFQRFFIGGMTSGSVKS